MSAPTVTYAGVPFLLPDERLLERLARYSPAELLPDVLPWPGDWPTADLIGLGLPAPPPLPKWLGLGDFFYPSGASRFAVFRGLMTGTSVAAVGALVTADPEDPQAFTMADGAGGTVTTPLHVLPPRPLAVDFGEDLYLVTLVCDRYFRQQRATPYNQTSGLQGLAITPLSNWQTVAVGPGYENGLIYRLMNLGLIPPTSSDLPTIDPAVYGRPEPDSALGCYFTTPFTTLLDAAAQDCGLGVVRRLNGNYAFQTYAAARTEAEKSRRVARSLAGALVPKAWGGSQAPYSGSDADDFRGAVVPRVTVLFPMWYDKGGYVETGDSGRHPEYRRGLGNVYAITPALADLGSPYSGWAFGPGRVNLRTTAKAVYAWGSLASPPTNLSAMTTLARQLARDLYDRHRAGLDITYPGVHGWVPDAANDVVWSVGYGRSCTRVVAPPLNWHGSEYHHRLADTVPAPLSFPAIITAVTTPNAAGNAGTPPVSWAALHDGSLTGTLNAWPWEAALGAACDDVLVGSLVTIWNNPNDADTPGSGGSVTGHRFHLAQPAGVETPGWLTTADQIVSGRKTFADGVVATTTVEAVGGFIAAGNSGVSGNHLGATVDLGIVTALPAWTPAVGDLAYFNGTSWVLLSAPVVDGTYTLQAVVTGGVPVVGWA